MSNNMLVEIINNTQAISAGIMPALYFGNNAYVHIRFAPNATPTNAQMTTTPNDYVGFCSNHDEVAPTTASSYIWARINSSAVQAAVEASMRAAEASATQSSASATVANTAKNDAQAAKTAAETARDNAGAKATEAASSATAANTAKTAAETAKAAAEAARTTATTKATEAANSATAADTAKIDAQTAKTAAEVARDDAATKATEATASATEAGTSKTDALAAKTAAESARNTATAKATEAANSATEANSAKAGAEAAKTAAETAKTTATTKATEAAASAVEAAAYAEAAGSAHPPVTIVTDTTSIAKPAAGGTVTMVDSVTRNGLGHVEKVNTKTVTLPTAVDITGKLDKTGDGKDVTVTFADQTTAQVSEIVSGSKLALLFGKIKKLLTDLIAHTVNKSNPHGVTAAQAGARPNTWMPTAAEVGARPSTWTPTAANVGADPTGTAASTVNTHNTNASAHSSLFAAKANATDLTTHTGNKSNPHGVTAAQAGARPNTWTPSAADVGAVPIARTVNGKALSANITLAATDVGARPSTWMPTAANVGAAVTSLYTASIPTTGWTGSAAPYSLSLTVTGILATDTPLIDIVQVGTESTDEIMRENWNQITRITTAAGKITVYADEVPSAAIPIQMKVVR